jgi:hypothetical protein
MRWELHNKSLERDLVPRPLNSSLGASVGCAPRTILISKITDSVRRTHPTDWGVKFVLKSLIIFHPIFLSESEFTEFQNLISLRSLLRFRMNT